jgi:hypothetical protein
MYKNIIHTICGLLNGPTICRACLVFIMVLEMHSTILPFHLIFKSIG